MKGENEIKTTTKNEYEVLVKFRFQGSKREIQLWLTEVQYENFKAIVSLDSCEIIDRRKKKY